MKSFLIEAKLLTGIFVVLTIATVISIADTESDVIVTKSPSEILKSESTTAETFQIKERRSPASLNVAKEDTLQVDFNCETSKQKIQKHTPERLVMLNLNLCENTKAVESISMVNVTNGFKAQLFKLGPKIYRSDFVQLSAGANIILIESILKDGQKREQTLEILSVLNSKQ